MSWFDFLFGTYVKLSPKINIKYENSSNLLCNLHLGKLFKVQSTGKFSDSSVAQGIHNYSGVFTMLHYRKNVLRKSLFHAGSFTSGSLL